MWIDRNKIYSIDNYAFKNFTALNETEIRMVWKWRNDERVRKWMRKSENIPWENHLDFVNSLSSREDSYYWVVYKDLFPLGVVDIYSIDKKNNSTEGGYYLAPEISDSGYGFEFHYYYKFFLFDFLAFNLVKGPLLLENLNSYALVTYCGGKVGEEIKIDGKNYVMMETLKEDFDKLKERGKDIKKFIRHVRDCKISWQNLNNRKK